MSLSNGKGATNEEDTELALTWEAAARTPTEVSSHRSAPGS